MKTGKQQLVRSRVLLLLLQLLLLLANSGANGSRMST